MGPFTPCYVSWRFPTEEKEAAVSVGCDPEVYGGPEGMRPKEIKRKKIKITLKKKKARVLEEELPLSQSLTLRQAPC